MAINLVRIKKKDWEYIPKYICVYTIYKAENLDHDELINYICLDLPARSSSFCLLSSQIVNSLMD